MVTIQWDLDIEPANKAEIEKHLNPYLWLVPKWVQVIYVSMYANLNCAVRTKVNDEYRTVELEFDTSWLNERDDTKTDNVIHELIHISVNQLFNAGMRIVGITDNEPFAKIAEADLREKVEMATQDLAYVIMNRPT